MTQGNEVGKTGMNGNGEEWKENTYVPDAQPPGPADADNRDDEDGEARKEDAPPPGAQPAEPIKVDDEGDEDSEGETEDTVVPGTQPSPFPDVSNGDDAPGDEDTLIGLSEPVPADDDGTSVGPPDVSPGPDVDTLINRPVSAPGGPPDVAPGPDADTLINRPVCAPGSPAGSPVQQPVVDPSSPTLRETPVPKRRASGDWKWLALGVAGLVLLLGLLGGILTLIYVMSPGGIPRPAPMIDPFPSRAQPRSKTGTPRATHTSPPVRTLTVGKMPTSTRERGAIETSAPIRTLAGTLVAPTPTGSPAPTSWSEPTLLLQTPSQPEDTSGPTSALTCTDDLRFVTDVTVPDDTTFGPSERFDKTWRVRNNGSCPWDAAYRLKFLSGDRMDAPDSQEVSPTTPGDTTEITVSMVAPRDPGAYTGIWQMVNVAGEPFGHKLTVVIQVVIQVATPGSEDKYELKPVE